MWAIKLKQVVDRIRERVLGSANFTFSEPEVVFIQKSPAEDEYRSLAILPLEDKVIDSIVARYLRQSLDRELLPSCLAFRCCRPAPTIHTALETILRCRDEWSERGIYVAECDIKSFFDCISHDVARASLRSLIQDAQQGNPQLVIDRRAMQIFDAYLNVYAFEDNVLRQYQFLQARCPKAQVKWPKEELHTLHGLNCLPRIGVPQGAALSCVIGNAVLHAADKELEALAASGRKFKYLRYCDDMIMLAPDKAACEEAFSRYCQLLQRLKLPVHPTSAAAAYAGQDKASFWKVKSKPPYLWARAGFGIPWIQFLGYQVRFDGLVRVRAKSLKKQRQKITEIADELLGAIRKHGISNGIRRSRNEILHRFRQRLIWIAVGRAKLGQSGVMPMCWTGGFRGLGGQEIVHAGLKALDRCREEQIKRVERVLERISLPKSKSGRNRKGKLLRYYGSPYSYCGRLGERGSRDEGSPNGRN